MQICIVTDAEKLELARSHYVDGVPNARIAKQYDVSEITIRNWIKPYKSQFSKEIMQRWYNREERIRVENPEPLPKKQNRKPRFGLRNKITGRWVQRLTSDGCMRTRLFPSKNAARAYRAKCGVCAEVYEADLFEWENVK